MENQSHSRVKKPKKNLKILLSGHSSDLGLESKFEIIKTSTTQSCDVDLIVGDKSTTIRSILNFSRNELAISKKNCSSFLKLLELKKFCSIHKDKKPIASIIANRSFNVYFKKLDHYLSKSHKQTPLAKTRSLLSVLNDDSTLDDLHTDSLSIHTFLSNLFDLSFFVNFTTIQLLIHEKGKNEAENHVLFKSGKYRKGSTSAAHFSQAYQSIKKSKTKIFNNFQLQQGLIEALGPFLAKEYELYDSSAILVISRDGFLPVSDEDYKYFNGVSPLLKSILINLIVKAKFSDRQKTLLCSLNFFPDPIIIKVGGNSIFKNKSFLNFIFDKNHTPKIYKLGNDRELHVWQVETEDTITDLGHFQRVSLLGELLNTLKHELSNPLFGLSLSSQLLFASTQDSEAKDFLQSISASTNRCNEIIMNFSSFYFESEKSKKILIEKIVSEVFTLSKSETKGIYKILEFKDGANSLVEIVTNPTLVSQILFNLIINSAQAIADKVTHPEIKVTVSKPDDKLIISVCDNGPDLEYDELENLFKPFYTTKKNGTGLGLSICKKLAKRLGGDLRHKVNKPFPGLTFSLILPD